MGEGRRRRIVRIGCRPGVGELAGGVDRAVQHIRNGKSADVPQLVHEHNGSDPRNIPDLRQIHHTADVQEQHHLFEVRPQKAQILQLFLGGQVVAPLIKTVRALAGIARDHVHSDIGICLLNVRGRDRLRRRDHKGMCKGQHHRLSSCLLRNALQLLHVRLLRFLAPRAVSRQPVAGGNRPSLLNESLLHGEAGAGIHIPGAGAALHRVIRPHAEQCQLSALGQRQCAVVFQQNNAFAGHAARQLPVPQLLLGHLITCRCINPSHVPLQFHFNAFSRTP